MNVVAQVMSQASFEQGTRSTATEVVLALSAQMPAVLRKTEETMGMFLPALVKMLTEVEEDEGVWADTEEEKEMSGTDPYSTAVNAINRVSVDLGEKCILGPCSVLIQAAVKSDKWQERQAGYMLMGLIAEACKDSMSKNMQEAMTMACTGVQDPNPRVRYAGLSCLALLLTELAPKAQKKFHAELMPVLMRLMNEEALIKMQTHTVSTIINFAKGLLAEDEEGDAQGGIMELYSQGLFESLVKLLQKAVEQNYEPLQEEVMSLLSVAASLIEKEFAKFYSVLMPMMLRILDNVGAVTMQQKTLRARTIEAMGFMIEAVSEEKAAFNDNVLQITGVLVNMLVQGLQSDDPQVSAIKETLCKIAFFLKEDFHTFMPLLLPSVLADTKLDIDIKMESAELPSAGAAGLTFKMKGLEGNQRITMNTSALESKLSAFKLLAMVSENLGTSFGPYCETVLPIMVENMSYQFSKKVRKFAMKTLNNMLTAVGEPNNVQLFSGTLLPLVMQTLQKNVERQDLKELKVILKHLWFMIKNLNENNKQSKNYMNEDGF